MALELLVRRTPPAKAAGSDLALTLLDAMHLDHAHLFDEVRVTSFAGRAGRVKADRGQLFCERRMNCEESRV